MSTRWAVLLAALLIAASADSRLSIGMSPRIVSEGGIVQIRCRVQRREEHRKLVAGVVNLGSSEVQLDGERAPMQHLFVFGHLDCASGDAYCELSDSVRLLQRVAATVKVAGCEGPEPADPIFFHDQLQQEREHDGGADHRQGEHRLILAGLRLS